MVFLELLVFSYRWEELIWLHADSYWGRLGQDSCCVWAGCGRQRPLWCLPSQRKNAQCAGGLTQAGSTQYNCHKHFYRALTLSLLIDFTCSLVLLIRSWRMLKSTTSLRSLACSTRRTTVTQSPWRLCVMERSWSWQIRCDTSFCYF